MLATLFATGVSALGRSDIELVNTLVSLVVFITAFLLGVRWDVAGLAVAYVVAVSLSFMLNFPRTARILGISLREIGAACRGSAISGAAMLIVVGAARLPLSGLTDALRLPILVVVGGATYIVSLLVLERAILNDARKVFAALRERS